MQRFCLKTKSDCKVSLSKDVLEENMLFEGKQHFHDHMQRQCNIFFFSIRWNKWQCNFWV